MLVYRSTARRVDVATALDSVEQRVSTLAGPNGADHDVLRSLLIEAGELEAALADGECPTEDATTPLTIALDALLVRLGAAFVRSWEGARLSTGAARKLHESIETVRRLAPRETIDAPISEGFAFYSLFPESYLSAARALITARAPKSALVIGIRSIGTTLSAVVAATLASTGIHVERITVRPHGHPFDRELRVTDRLADVMRSHVGATSDIVAIVDEGPGISGSSFASVADFASRLGFADERIVFLPSWDASSGALRNERARERWTRHDRFLGDFDREWIASGRLGGSFDARITANLSAGAWRRRLYSSPAEYPPTHPQHERRKYLASRADGTRVFIKFEGLGWYGETSVARSRRLAAAGFGSPVLDYRDGFTATAWMPGTPLREVDVTPQFLRQVARYLAWLGRHEATRTCADPEPLLAMLKLNVSEGLGREWASCSREMSECAASVGRAPAIRLDNRMMPHEWLRTSDGFIKTDGASHNDDHFYPGPHDIAWDLAGASIELTRDWFAERALIAEYIAESGDVEVAGRLPFMRAAYAAFRLGYATMAAEALGGTPDGSRMLRESDRYAAVLRSTLSGLHRAEPSAIEYGQSYATGA